MAMQDPDISDHDSFPAPIPYFATDGEGLPIACQGIFDPASFIMQASETAEEDTFIFAIADLAINGKRLLEEGQGVQPPVGLPQQAAPTSQRAGPQVGAQALVAGAFQEPLSPQIRPLQLQYLTCGERAKKGGFELGGGQGGFRPREQVLHLEPEPLPLLCPSVGAKRIDEFLSAKRREIPGMAQCRRFGFVAQFLRRVLPHGIEHSKSNLPCPRLYAPQ